MFRPNDVFEGRKDQHIVFCITAFALLVCGLQIDLYPFVRTALLVAQGIVASATVQGVCATFATADRVVTCTAANMVGLCVSNQQVVARRTDDVFNIAQAVALAAIFFVIAAAVIKFCNYSV